MGEEKEETSMTPDERMEWLRARGIFIETSEDREAKRRAEEEVTKTKTNASAAPNTNATADIEVIKYVYIPADSSKSMEELTLNVSSVAKRRGCIDLLEMELKPKFASDGDEERSMDIERVKEYAGKHFGSSNTPTISDATLRSVAAQGNVEVFKLVPALESNKFCQISFYLDEVGSLKQLPLNARAMKMAFKAGFNPAPQFYGDIYVGRLQTKPYLKNLSFTLDVDASLERSPWLRRAVAENLQHQSEMNKLTGRVGELQPSADGEDGIDKQEEGFSWTQTPEEVEIRIECAPESTSRDVKVKFLPTRVEAKIKTMTVLSIHFFAPVDPDGCTWTFEKNDQPTLVLSCEKMDGISWPQIKK